MADPFSDQLYSDRLKNFSHQADALLRLTPAQNVITTDAYSIICGSTVKLDVQFSPDGKIIEIGGETDGCALTKTALVILCLKAKGKNRDDLQKLHHEMDDLLSERSDHISAPFEDLLVLKPAREYKARHSSILLPFVAILRAFTLWEKNYG